MRIKDTTLRQIIKEELLRFSLEEAPLTSKQFQGVCTLQGTELEAFLGKISLKADTDYEGILSIDDGKIVSFKTGDGKEINSTNVLSSQPPTLKMLGNVDGEHRVTMKILKPQPGKTLTIGTQQYAGGNTYSYLFTFK